MPDKKCGERGIGNGVEHNNDEQKKETNGGNTHKAADKNAGLFIFCIEQEKMQRKKQDSKESEDRPR